MARTDGGGTVDAAMADDGGRLEPAALWNRENLMAELPVPGRLLKLLKDLPKPGVSSR